MAIQLYSWPHSSGTRVSWALEELGLAYEYITLDAAKREHRTERYLAIHPQGKVPALVDGDKRFFESGAILLHLGQSYGIERGLWPQTGQDHADALCWTVWSMAELGQSMLQYMYHGLDTPVSYQPQDRSPAAAAYSLSEFTRCLDALARRLAQREHLFGSFTLADIAPASWLMFGTLCGVKLDTHPLVAQWLQRCASRPALERAR